MCVCVDVGCVCEGDRETEAGRERGGGKGSTEKKNGKREKKESFTCFGKFFSILIILL